jgi:hypothetical protein
MLIVAQSGSKLPRWLMAINPDSAATANDLFEAPPAPAPPAAVQT